MSRAYTLSGSDLNVFVQTDRDEIAIPGLDLGPHHAVHDLAAGTPVTFRSGPAGCVLGIEPGDRARTPVSVLRIAPASGPGTFPGPDRDIV